MNEGWADQRRLSDDELPDRCLSTTFGEREGTQEVGIFKQSGIHTEDTKNCDLADSAVARTGSRASYGSYHHVLEIFLIAVLLFCSYKQHYFP